MRVLALLFAATAVFAQDPVDFRGWLDRGIQEFQQARYPQAVAAFERAAAIDPGNLSAQLYLGTVYMQEYIPGSDSLENARVAEAAQSHFVKVLAIDSSNTLALASMASLMINQKKWDDAQQWYQKLTAIDPSNADAYYSQGFIAWSRWYPEYGKARMSVGLAQADPGPIPDAAVRADLTARFGGIIESGLQSLQKALEIKPDFADAMAYMNLLIRERADLRATQAEWKQDVAIADEWVQRALAAKKAQFEKGTATVQVAPPPPPPPPPSGSPAGAVKRITMEGPERRRTRDVPPVYPENARQAGVQGQVVLKVIIDQQGRPIDITLVSGHPMLVKAAFDAVKQWEWAPTLLNGQPVEVVTQVSVAFVM